MDPFTYMLLNTHFSIQRRIFTSHLLQNTLATQKHTSDTTNTCLQKVTILTLCFGTHDVFSTTLQHFIKLRGKIVIFFQGVKIATKGHLNLIILVSRGEGKIRTLDHLNCCVFSDKQLDMIKLSSPIYLFESIVFGLQILVIFFGMCRYESIIGSTQLYVSLTLMTILMLFLKRNLKLSSQEISLSPSLPPCVCGEHVKILDFSCCNQAALP